MEFSNELNAGSNHIYTACTLVFMLNVALVIDSMHEDVTNRNVLKELCSLCIYDDYYDHNSLRATRFVISLCIKSVTVDKSLHFFIMFSCK